MGVQVGAYNIVVTCFGIEMFHKLLLSCLPFIHCVYVGVGVCFPNCVKEFIHRH